MSLIEKTLAAAALATLGFAGPALANPTVGGAQMFANRTIVENAANSPIHKTLVAAVTEAGLVETLSGPGPFTVFAPTDSAFARISDESLAALMQPENRGQLQQVLGCHVVQADAMAAAIRGMVDDDGGRHAVSTVGGCTLQASYSGGTLMLTDENGRTANVTIADVDQSNGVIHVIDRVLLPRQ